MEQLKLLNEAGSLLFCKDIKVSWHLDNDKLMDNIRNEAKRGLIMSVTEFLITNPGLASWDGRITKRTGNEDDGRTLVIRYITTVIRNDVI